ncbi:hypothetical protein GF385_00555 [Candidatus Dependentiae bacterium]|nr:hypothetical protein [Candidatus Dependentiae bacterium]
MKKLFYVFALFLLIFSKIKPEELSIKDIAKDIDKELIAEICKTPKRKIKKQNKLKNFIKEATKSIIRSKNLFEKYTNDLTNEDISKLIKELENLNYKIIKNEKSYIITLSRKDLIIKIAQCKFINNLEKIKDKLDKHQINTKNLLKESGIIFMGIIATGSTIIFLKNSESTREILNSCTDPKVLEAKLKKLIEFCISVYKKIDKDNIKEYGTYLKDLGCDYLIKFARLIRPR